VTADRPTDVDWAVRTLIYRIFAETGSAPALDELASETSSSVPAVRRSLERLYAAHEIAPLPDGEGVWMANPFSAIPTDYVVETPRITCFANCAWDALGVPAIVETDGWIRTRCARSGEILEFGIEGGALRGDDGVIHLLTPLRDAWTDIGFT